MSKKKDRINIFNPVSVIVALLLVLVGFAGYGLTSDKLNVDLINKLIQQNNRDIEEQLRIANESFNLQKLRQFEHEGIVDIITQNVTDSLHELAANPQTTFEEQKQLFEDVKDIKNILTNSTQ